MVANKDINFEVNKEKCIKCGKCVKDCPVHIIEMDDYPQIVQDGMKCLKCEHCFAVCPTGAISILGDTPLEDENTKFDVDYEQLKKMIFSRRAVRNYKDENIDKVVIDDLCKSALHAPTAKNDLNTLLTVINDKDKMQEFKTKVYETVGKLNITDPSQGFLKMIVDAWNKDGADKLFAGAPHMIVASAPKGSYNLLSDPVITLSYFEMLAVAKGFGTLWDGVMLMVLEQIAPELKDYLKIPKDHQVGYVMMFGKPAVKYQRPARRNPDSLKYID